MCACERINERVCALASVWLFHLPRQKTEFVATLRRHWLRFRADDQFLQMKSEWLADWLDVVGGPVVIMANEGWKQKGRGRWRMEGPWFG